ncbi:MULTISPECIES: HlyD family type I secretion periplasmic adaptor subunit [unclassified Nitratiruptor]|uniref:HlyD family type I secretion periplasmic adaptor subunit n=1 Tax=unclassified Nitratiruptor TaxID=2624044 RepID=UPI0019162200|nr:MULTISPECIES: HlyD family type I secretion periplasmic adaptor subunit [unclassified Nitratiruptor]BCD60708.1 membrane fusion protein, epimerase transport system [Nitratiruptor sp. YY08-10]BCD64641.1 membrane fusion protein, epimerase transport system [Nitratiruptor sp. YY08-14]
MEDLNQKLTHKHVSLFGLIIIFLIFGLFGLWAALAKIDLSVNAPGEVIVQSYKKTVMHPKGGIVSKIEVHEGDAVQKNQTLIQLDTNQLTSRLQEAKSNYEHLLAQKARIEAELHNKKDIEFPNDISEDIKKAERTIFQNRRTNLQNRLDDLKYQIKELKEAIQSYQTSLQYKQKLLDSYRQELQKWQNLFKEGLVDELKIYDLKRKINQVQGEIEALQSQIQQKKATIEELQNKMKLTISEYRKELLDTLKKDEMQLASLKSKIAIYKDELEKSSIKAPGNGVVVDMQVHSPGEVILPNRPILYIVPKNEKLIVEAKISPMDIDKVHVGQKAEIHFASYVDPSAKPVYGKVIYVSADVIKDPRDPRIQYYKALIEITPEGMRAIRENGFKVVPGMPVTVFIKAGQRTFLSYILTPLQQLLKGAFHAN